MRTYFHALLTRRAFRHRGRLAATAATVGATLPDLPALAGAAWLAAGRLEGFSRESFESEVCGRSLFARPDAALHSAVPVAAALSGYAISGTRYRDTESALLSFLLGWAGHVLTDALTHGTDARPFLWPVSNRRFESPISYRERDRHALPLTIFEHAAVLAILRGALLKT